METKTCGNCKNWPQKTKEFNNCIAIKVGTDVRISGNALQTSASFSCNKWDGIIPESTEPGESQKTEFTETPENNMSQKTESEETPETKPDGTLDSPED